MPSFKRIDHVVIATEDLADAAAKWERNLGLKVTERVSRPLGSGFEVARLPVGDAFIELVQPVEETGRFADQFRERGEGFFSISIEVDDLDAAVGYLREKGARVGAVAAGLEPCPTPGRPEGLQLQRRLLYNPRTGRFVCE